MSDATTREKEWCGALTLPFRLQRRSTSAGAYAAATADVAAAELMTRRQHSAALTPVRLVCSDCLYSPPLSLQRVRQSTACSPSLAHSLTVTINALSTAGAGVQRPQEKSETLQPVTIAAASVIFHLKLPLILVSFYCCDDARTDFAEKEGKDIGGRRARVGARARVTRSRRVGVHPFHTLRHLLQLLPLHSFCFSGRLSLIVSLSCSFSASCKCS